MTQIAGQEEGAQNQRFLIGRLDIDTAAATAASGAATVATCGMAVVTSEALATAAGADYTLAVTWPDAAAGDVAIASVASGTNTQGDLLLGATTVAAGSVTQIVRNGHASQALNGTIVVSLLLIKKRQTPVPI
jgi:hypothetical protein